MAGYCCRLQTIMCIKQHLFLRLGQNAGLFLMIMQIYMYRSPACFHRCIGFGILSCQTIDLERWKQSLLVLLGIVQTPSDESGFWAEDFSSWWIICSSQAHLKSVWAITALFIHLNDLLFWVSVEAVVFTCVLSKQALYTFLWHILELLLIWKH
jgi:hypothetical protein